MSWEKKESSTTAKTALGLSIGALGVELLGAGGGNILSGLLGRNQSEAVTPAIMQAVVGMIPQLMQCGCSCNRGVVSALEAEIAQLKAEKYSDLGNINTFREAQALVEKVETRHGELLSRLNEEAVNNRVEAARLDERLKCLQKEQDYKLASVAATAKADTEALRNEMKLGFTNLGHAIEVESERRAAADQNIREWSDCKYVQYKKVVDASQICPPVQLAATAGGASNAQPSNVVVSGTVTTQAATA
jgi:hypothetical protein